MLKLALAAAISISALTIAPLPVLTGTALAQRCTFTGPNCPGGPSSDTYRCSDQLGYLRRVYEDELDVIDNPNYVSVVPICMNEDVGIFRTDGNAGALRGVIADNDAMMEALLDAAFGSEDVVGVRMIRWNKVILFVHPFGKRSE